MLTQLPRQDSMLVHALSDITEREKLEPVDETEVYQLVCLGIEYI